MVVGRKSGVIEQELMRVATLKDAGTETVREEVAKFLGSHHAMVVAKAAEICGTRGVTDAVDELVAAMGRTNEKTDKGCVAKTAILTALYQLEIQERMRGPVTAVFVSMLHYVQMEPAFGGPVDTAGELRGRAILGLAKMEDRRTLVEAAGLLTDEAAPARIAAVRALSLTGGEGAAAVLRLKTLVGDVDPEVMAEAFGALLEVDAEANLAFVAGFLEPKGRDAMSERAAEGAAMALGASRRAEVLEYLEKAWGRWRGSPLAQTLLLAMALARCERGIDFLLGIVQSGRAGEATAAMIALAIYRHDDRVVGRLKGLLEKRNERGLWAMYREQFG